MAVQGQLNFEERPAASAGRPGRPPSAKILARNREIVHRFREGQPLGQIAAEVGIATRSIRDILKAAGQPVPDKRRDPRLHRPPESAGREKEILARYAQGEKMSEIAQDWQISRQRVSQIIQKAQREIRC